MKLMMSSQSMKRIQFLTSGKRLGRSSSFTRSSSSAVAAAAIVVGSKRKGGPLGWWGSRSYVPKKWVYKFRAQLKKAIAWKKSNSSTCVKYSYDIQSYSLNFDDGACNHSSTVK